MSSCLPELPCGCTSQGGPSSRACGCGRGANKPHDSSIAKQLAAVRKELAELKSAKTTDAAALEESNSDYFGAKPPKRCANIIADSETFKRYGYFDT